MKVLCIDIETYSSINLLKSGVYKYVSAPDFKILMLAYSWWGEDEVHLLDLTKQRIPKWLRRALVDPQITKTAYNAAFEIMCLAWELDIELDYAQWDCTMVRGGRSGYTMNLGATAKAMGIDEQKDAAGSRLIQFFSIPCKPTKKNGMRTRNFPEHDPEKWQQFCDYCKQDVRTEKAIREYVIKVPVTDFETKLWVLDQKINNTGIRLDKKLVQNAIKIYEAFVENLKDEAKFLTGLDNPNSRNQLVAWLAENGEEVEDLKKATVKTLMKKLAAGDQEAVLRVLEIRQQMAKTSVKKYYAMLDYLNADGRVRNLLQFYGANRTGRWSGRGIQLQNLPQNHLKVQKEEGIDDLSLARSVARSGNADLFEFMYDNVPDTLSQLIRTAFIGGKGKRLVVADFSSVEAGVIAYLAGEKWRLDVFNSHGKIYEASGAKMFNVPLETIVKGGKNYELRAKSKIAELSMGYQGSKGALINMGALSMGLNEDELPEIVRLWRQANRKIVEFWYDCQRCAINAIMNPKKSFKGKRGLEFFMKRRNMYIKLPSGRLLCYVGAKITTNRFGKPGVAYWGMDQRTKKWSKQETYGGKLVENCLGFNTFVLTDSGWLKITEVTTFHKLWDGVEWVNHSGLLAKGIQETIQIDGVSITEDHLILTEHGWKNASQSEGLIRYACSLPDGIELRGIEWNKVNLERPMRLRKNFRNGCRGVFKRKMLLLRLQKERANWSQKYDAQPLQASDVPRLEVYESSMFKPKLSRLEQLRRTWNYCLRPLAIRLQVFSGRYGAVLRERSDLRAPGRERKLSQRELRLGFYETTSKQQAHKSFNRNTLGSDERGRSCRDIGNKRDNATLPYKEQLSARPFVRQAGVQQQVYDLVNAGPRHRFTVKSEKGEPFIVHNCVQAFARDCLAVALVNLDEAGFKVVLHVHDEAVIELPYSDPRGLKEIIEIMTQPIAWAPGLPLRADGFESKYYKKD